VSLWLIGFSVLNVFVDASLIKLPENTAFYHFQLLLSQNMAFQLHKYFRQDVIRELSYYMVLSSGK
jgi:hypothetical protein